MAVQYALHLHIQLRGNLAVEIVFVVRNHDERRALRQGVQRAAENRHDVLDILGFGAFGCAVGRCANFARA
jgi:hypothetical protein